MLEEQQGVNLAHSAFGSAILKPLFKPPQFPCHLNHKDFHPAGTSPMTLLSIFSSFHPYQCLTIDILFCLFDLEALAF